MTRSMKQTFQSKVRFVLGLLRWLVCNAPLLGCLLGYPLTLWRYGMGYPALARAVAPLLGRLFGGNVWLAIDVFSLALFSLVALAAGHLVGLAWAVRNGWKEDWLWRLLYLAVTVGLVVFSADHFFLCLTALAGLLALFGQGIPERVLLRVCLIILGIGCAAFLMGVLDAALPPAGRSAAGPAEEIPVLFWAFALPLVMLTGSSVLTSRRMSRRLAEYTRPGRLALSTGEKKERRTQ